MNNYLFMSRSPNRNIGYSARAAANAIRKPKPGLLYQMKDFLTNNWIAWFLHDWHIRKRFAYPAQASASIHRLRSHRGAGHPVSLLVAADWATATPQAGFVGDCMQRFSPDYTIHLGRHLLFRDRGGTGGQFRGRNQQFDGYLAAGRGGQFCARGQP
jgi:hypothetical protein